MGVLDEPVIVNDSDDNAIAKWVATNPEFVLFVEPIGNTRSTAMAQHTANKVGGTGAGNGKGSDVENSVGFNVCNGVGSSLEVSVGGNLGKGVVCLGAQPATTATSLAFSWFNSVAQSLVAVILLPCLP